MIFGIESDIDKYTRRLERMGNKALPAAIATTLDNVAFTARGEANKQFEADHVIRSTWTQRGTRYERTKRGVPIRTMESTVGSIRDYAPDLEVGGVIRPRAKHLMSPTLAARGGNKSRRIRPMARLSKLTPRRMPNVKGGARVRFSAMLNLARKESYYGPFLITESEAAGEKLPVGIFMLSKAGRKNRKGGSITMLRKFQSTARIIGHSFIQKGSIQASKRMSHFYVKNAKRLLR